MGLVTRAEPMPDDIFGQMPIGLTEQIDRGCGIWACGWAGCPVDGDPISLRCFIRAAVLSGNVRFIQTCTELREPLGALHARLRTDGP